MEVNEIILFGLKMRSKVSKRGALISLEGDKAYLVNNQRTAAFRIHGKDFGTGTFYSNEATPDCKIYRDDGLVVFQRVKDKKVERISIPEKDLPVEKFEKTFEEYYSEPDTPLREEIFSLIDDDILFTTLRLEGGKTIVEQTRSDGSVRIERELTTKTLAGILGKTKNKKITFFTRDFTCLDLSFISNIKIWIKDEKSPLSIKAKFKNGTLEGIISPAIYG